MDKERREIVALALKLQQTQASIIRLNANKAKLEADIKKIDKEVERLKQLVDGMMRPSFLDIEINDRVSSQLNKAWGI